jgi:hypothetical protein
MVSIGRRFVKKLEFWKLSKVIFFRVKGSHKWTGIAKHYIAIRRGLLKSTSKKHTLCLLAG